MKCRTITLKLDKSKLSARKREILKQLFTQSKYLYNHLLEQIKSGKTYKEINTKIKEVPVLTPDGYEDRVIDLLSSQVKQGIFEQLKTNRKSMIENVRAGNNKHSQLRFISSFTSIPLKQTNVTYKIDIKKKRFYLQGIGWFRIDGAKQLAELGDKLELANAKLIVKPSGWYLQVTTYAPPESKPYKGVNVGLDFGIEKNIATSDGEIIDACFEEPESLKKAQKANACYIEWSKKHGKKKSSLRQKRRISREYEKLSNAKDDLANKVVHELLSTYDLIFIQDESLKAWQQDKRYSRSVHHSIMGRVIRKLRSSSQTIMVDKWTRTTGVCPECGHVLEEKLPTSVRSWECPGCGTVHDRDVASAQSMVMIGLSGLCELSSGVLSERLSEKNCQRGFEHALEVLRLGDTVVSGSLDCPQHHAPKAFGGASSILEAHAL